MPVLVQAGRSAGPKQGHLFHNPSRRRLWKTLISNFLLWRNYKVEAFELTRQVWNGYGPDASRMVMGLDLLERP